MKIKLPIIENWKMVSLKSYTALAFFVLAILVLMPDFIYKFFGVETNPAVWTSLLLLTVFLGFIGRFILQPKENRWRRRGIIAVIVFIAVVMAWPAAACEAHPDNTDQITVELVKSWEGENKTGNLHESYFDTIAKPPLWTICYGHTKTAVANQFKTDAECDHLLKLELQHYRAGVSSYFTVQTRSDRLTPHRQAAYTSLAYNVGIRGAGRSTATRRLNKGDIIGGCKALTWWNRAGGRVVRGLVKRRAEEEAYCLRGTEAANASVRTLFR